MPAKIVAANIVSMILQYAMVFVIYYLLFKMVKIMWGGLRPDASAAEDFSAAALAVVDGPPFLKGRFFSLRADRLSIGRGGGNDVVIDDGYVSHRHACVTLEGAAYVLTDLGSTNDTYLNGRPLQGKARLAPGDEIRIGTVTFKFER